MIVAPITQPTALGHWRRPSDCHTRNQSSLPQEPLQAVERSYFAGLAPRTELANVHAAIPGLAVVDPRLWTTEPLAESALRQFGLVTQIPKQLRHRSVAAVVLRLCGHLHSMR